MYMAVWILYIQIWSRLLQWFVKIDNRALSALGYDMLCYVGNSGTRTIVSHLLVCVTKLTEKGHCERCQTAK